MTSRFFCATAARQRDDPLIGTAAPARRWLLVEYAAAWAPHSLDSGRLAGTVAGALQQAVMETGGRVLLIRRPGRRQVATRQVWGVLDHDGPQQWGSWSDAEDLLEAARTFRAGPGSHVDPEDATATSAKPLLLVCTHGLHDTCCAMRGRPVAAALAAHWPEQTWECTHIGGDRFAASIVVVPDGTYYGRLDAESAPGVVRSHLEGAVDLDHLRGFASEPPLVQAAMAEVLRRHGPGNLAQLRVLSVTTDGSHAWRVVIRMQGTTTHDVETHVTRTTRPPARLTCAAQGSSTAYAYLVDGVHELV
jgi:hypothetical protein